MRELAPDSYLLITLQVTCYSASRACMHLVRSAHDALILYNSGSLAELMALAGCASL